MRHYTTVCLMSWPELCLVLHLTDSIVTLRRLLCGRLYRPGDRARPVLLLLRPLQPRLLPSFFDDSEGADGDSGRCAAVALHADLPYAMAGLSMPSTSNRQAPRAGASRSLSGRLLCPQPHGCALPPDWTGVSKTALRPRRITSAHTGSVRGHQ